MKKTILSLTLLFVACVQMPPEYEAPTLTAPTDGATFSEFVTFEWLPNNRADWTTGDFSFFVEIAADTEFTQIKAHYLTKLETRFYAPLPAFKNGVLFWRVTATYAQSPSGEKTVLRSAVRSFTYTGNDGAVYVDPASVGAGVLGTKAEPVKTIAAAFDVARRRGLSDLRLANANYGETIGLGGVTLKACYDAATWARNTGACATTISDAAAVAYYSPFN